jgi:hypothetical protein
LRLVLRLARWRPFEVVSRINSSIAMALKAFPVRVR